MTQELTDAKLGATEVVSSSQELSKVLSELCCKVLSELCCKCKQYFIVLTPVLFMYSTLFAKRRYFHAQDTLLILNARIERGAPASILSCEFLCVQ